MQLVEPLNQPVDDFPAANDEDRPSHYQFLTCWIRHSPMRVREGRYFIQNSETTAWGIREDLVDYVQGGVLALSAVL